MTPINATAGATGGSVQVIDQIQDPGFIPPPGYRSSPLYLLIKDLMIVAAQLPYLPLVFFPLNLDRGWLFEDL